MVKRRVIAAIALGAILVSCRSAEERASPEPLAEEPVAQEPAPEELEIPEPIPPEGEPPLQRAVQERMGAPAPAAAGAPTPELREAREAYDQAWVEIVQNGELEAGLELLERAVALDPDFGEAWFELGTGKVTLALQRLGEGREVEGESSYRRGIADQRRARELLGSGKVRVYDAFELHEKLSALDTELEDADARLSDPEAVAERLRELAVERGWLEAEPAEGEAGAEPEEPEAP